MMPNVSPPPMRTSVRRPCLKIIITSSRSRSPIVQESPQNAITSATTASEISFTTRKVAKDD
eukprot:8789263-Prorocentrum_lima.AAC.1